MCEAFRMKKALAMVFLVSCGGKTVPPPPDAGAGCVPGKTFCPADSGYSVCGNIARWRDDCTIEYGCCLDGTPTCQDGQCIDWSKH